MQKARQWYFTDARELFRAARDASHDADRVRLQLARMDAESGSLCGGFGLRVRSTPDPHRMEARAAASADRKEVLERRLEGDYALIDIACWVLYGRDNETGLSVLVPEWWCDVLWWRYLHEAKWEVVADAVGYSEQRCRQVAEAALDTVDAWGLVATMQGRPLNTPESWERDRRRAKKISSH